MKISIPNFTQTPNEIFDEWLPVLSHVELKVLMVIMRKTFGWHRIRDRISLSQLEKITGSKRYAIINASKKLQILGLITKKTEGKKGLEETYYELVIIDNSNISYQSPGETGEGSPGETHKRNLVNKNIDPLNPPKGGEIPPKIERKKMVTTTEKEHSSLIEKYGKELVEKCYNFLSDWKKDQPKSKHGGDDNKKIHRWVAAAVLEQEKRDKFVKDQLQNLNKTNEEKKENSIRWKGKKIL